MLNGPIIECFNGFDKIVLIRNFLDQTFLKISFNKKLF